MSRRQSVMKINNPFTNEAAPMATQATAEEVHESEEDIPEYSVDIALLRPKDVKIAMVQQQKKEAFPVSPKKEASQVSLPVSVNSSDEGWVDEGPSVKIPITTDDGAVFADKMRTAAVLLAQLYQQQQKEAAINGKQRGRTRSRSSSVTSNPDLLAKIGTPTTATSATVDKRTQLKRKNEFETIRTRVLQEMSASEDERLNYLNSSKGKKSLVSRRVDEILADMEEKGSERDAEDPSGKKRDRYSLLTCF